MREGRGRTWRSGVIALAACALPGFASSASAGAWTQAEGRGLAILTVERVSAQFRFERDRRRTQTASFEKSEARLYVEYGLSERVTLLAQTALEAARDGDPRIAPQRGWGVQELGGRVRLLDRGPFVGSAQASLRVADASASTGPVLEYEARLLAGAGATIADRPAFVDVQLGYRIRPDASSDEILLDLTAGLRPFERTLLLLQTFSGFSAMATSDEFLAYDRHKAQASVVFDLTTRWSLQLGGALTVSGANVADERSAFGAVWLRF